MIFSDIMGSSNFSICHLCFPFISAGKMIFAYIFCCCFVFGTTHFSKKKLTDDGGKKNLKHQPTQEKNTVQQILRVFSWTFLKPACSCSSCLNI